MNPKINFLILFIAALILAACTTEPASAPPTPVPPTDTLVATEPPTDTPIPTVTLTFTPEPTNTFTPTITLSPTPRIVAVALDASYGLNELPAEMLEPLPEDQILRLTKGGEPVPYGLYDVGKPLQDGSTPIWLSGIVRGVVEGSLGVVLEMPLATGVSQYAIVTIAPDKGYKPYDLIHTYRPYTDGKIDSNHTSIGHYNCMLENFFKKNIGKVIGHQMMFRILTTKPGAEGNKNNAAWQQFVDNLAAGMPTETGDLPLLYDGIKFNATKWLDKISRETCK